MPSKLLSSFESALTLVKAIFSAANGPALKLLFWLGLCATMAALFVALILVRITTPRFKLETLSKLGWGASLLLTALFFCLYLVAFLLA